MVCHQVRSPDNLGAVARLMANFGFSRLTLSEPVTYAFREAEKLAVGAAHLLDSLRLVSSLQEAVGPAVYAVGTTSRAELKGRVALSPEEAVKRLSTEAARGPVALVFGGEKRGLSDDELSVCQDVLVIPTEPAQPSMNLSQAVAVLLYLCAREDRGEGSESTSVHPERGEAQSGGSPRRGSGRTEVGARLETIQVLEAALGELLLGAGYLNPQAPEHALRELGRSLTRARLTQREAEMWLSAFQHLRRAGASKLTP